MAARLEVPARQGRAVLVPRGQALRVINTFGHQVVDFWAFGAGDTANYLSMSHTRIGIGRVNPRAGDKLLDSHREPMILFESDDSPGVHDTLLPACDPARYRLLGYASHESCGANMERALAALERKSAICPQPLNLWMNIPFRSDGQWEFREPVSKAGDAVVLRALADCVMVMSACPQDTASVPVNAGKPVSVHYELVD